MNIRLMLADDHRMLREGLRRSMTEEGFDIVG
jgi:DNA-binding NarL/FixJ family response regulator